MQSVKIVDQTAQKASENKVEFNIKQFALEVKSEFKKISWPSKDQVTQEFTTVILLVTVLTGIIYFIDVVLGFVSELFIG